MFRQFGVSLILISLVCSYSASAQIPSIGQQRITLPIIIDGQQALGVMIVQEGTVQSVSCPAPQNYVAADQSSSGWACYEPSTGTWLLHAQPPPDSAAPQTFTYQQPPVYVPAPTAPVYSYLAPGYY